MPSTVLSKSAESNTTTGDLPPSSKDSFFPEPAVNLRRTFPTYKKFNIQLTVSMMFIKNNSSITTEACNKTAIHKLLIKLQYRSEETKQGTGTQTGTEQILNEFRERLPMKR